MNKLSMILEQLLFHWPWAFVLLPIPWLFRWLLKPAKKSWLSSNHQALKIPFFEQMSVFDVTKKNTPSYKVWMLYGLWILLVIGLARPFTILDELPIPTQTRDIMMAIDLSGSMQKNYLTGGRANRLDVVKAAADTFIQRRPTDRFGLVFFSDRAYVQSPLTLDNQLVRELLKEAQVGLTGSKTAIGDAIAISLKRFKQLIESKSNKTDKKDNYENKVLILLTDGANTAGVISPKVATELAKKMGVKIYTIGVGKEVKGLFSVGKELDDQLLDWIAKTTQGEYFRAQDKTALDRIYTAIDALEPSDQSPQYFKIEKEWFHYPVGLAFIMSLLWLVLSALLPLFRNRWVKKDDN